ncbi:YbaB/EbfC family nucleoid-associated protein [Haloechinothrix sp. LS1_15]|uniref:YbaB/EbfC family nucleoid-associated protein n=1 Tax=Haloechinothrix sp. LS1_15 TaxID=2652248 RepID=UPI00294B8A27|nr:YbaB/EbfC family nucleoid-associated protein [Haloechinothrix sp. LS1_15]
MVDHRARVDELLTEYHRSREQLAATHRELATIREATSVAGGLVTATVGPLGTLEELRIAPEAYARLTATELSSQIVRATTEAAARARSRAADVLAGVLPTGTDPHALLLGTTELSGHDGAGAIAPGRSGRQVPRQDAGWVRETGAGASRYDPRGGHGGSGTGSSGTSQAVSRDRDADDVEEEDFALRSWVPGGRADSR